ncbi:MAG: cadherin-like beta sandwich domain-containing protein [Bdellovibrionaceae bacterium]|nr:cadherin-like beta sandwich domain-containing protein [Pseudobdellovibrionaceae bacterium]
MTACVDGGVSLGISSDKEVSGISVGSGNLTPSFSKDIAEYTADAGFLDETFDVTLDLSSSKSTFQVNGVSPTAGNTVRVPLTVGENKVVIVVTAEDGTQKTYTITVTKSGASPNSDLQTLALSSGVLNPSFTSGTKSYTSSVLYSVSSVNVTATTASTRATFTTHGLSAISGISTAVALNVGVNLIPLVVTAQDGTQTTYNVSVTRAAASTNADISTLSLSSGSLSPSFSSSVTSYAATFPYATSNVGISATLSSGYASFTINGQAATSGNILNVALAVGANVIPVVVTAESGVQKTYTLTLTRQAASSVSTLSALSLSSGTLAPVFASGTSSYTIAISNIPASYTVTATTSSSLASVQYRVNSGVLTSLTSGVASAAITPSGGANTLEVVVTAENNTTRTYTVTMTYAVCGAGYYSDIVNGCEQVGLGYYSPANDNNRYACSNMPTNARYTSPTASTASCPWSCNNEYITTNGTTCSSFPNARILACDDNEVAVGLYGRDGSIIDRLGVRCATIDASGNLGTPRNGPDYGGNGGTDFNNSGEFDCPAGYAVYRVEGSLATYSSAPRTGTVSFLCKSVTNPAMSGVWRPNRPDTDFGNSTDRGPYSFECGVSPNLFGAYFNGIIIDNAAGAAYTGDILGVTCR